MTTPVTRELLEQRTRKLAVEAIRFIGELPRTPPADIIGRPGLDLKRRELCTVATTVVLATAEQLHSHLRGALNTGASAAEIEAVLGAIDGDLDAEQRGTARKQWEDVKKRKL